MRDHVKLICDGKLDIPPGVGEELRELRLFYGDLDDLWRDKAEEPRGFFYRLRRYARDELGQFFQLFHGISLHDPLGTIRDVPGPLPAQHLEDLGAGMGIDRASDDDGLASGEVRL